MPLSSSNFMSLSIADEPRSMKLAMPRWPTTLSPARKVIANNYSGWGPPVHLDGAVGPGM